MKVLNFVINEIFGQGAIFLALVAMIGLLLQKKKPSEVVRGTIMTAIGFFVLNTGTGLITGNSIDGIITTFSTKSEFKRMMYEYLKTYGFILSRLDAIPRLTSYSIFKYDSFDKVLELAMEDRVNIYYLYDDYTCDFLFMSGENLYIYTLKEDEKYHSRVDKYFIEQQIVTK